MGKSTKISMVIFQFANCDGSRQDQGPAPYAETLTSIFMAIADIVQETMGDPGRVTTIKLGDSLAVHAGEDRLGWLFYMYPYRIYMYIYIYICL